MFESPEWATMIGYPEADRGRWSDDSLAADERWRARSRKILEVLDAIDRDALDVHARLNYDLFRYQVERSIEGDRFPGEYLVINQMGGVQQWIPQFLTQVPARSAKDYEDLLTWMRGVPEQLVNTRVRLEKGLETGVLPPKVTLSDVADQIAAQAPEDPTESPLYRPFAQLSERAPESMSAAERERLQAEARQVIAETVGPAFRQLHRFWVEEYYPKTRESIAMSELPDGAAWYAYNVRTENATDLTPSRSTRSAAPRRCRRTRLLDPLDEAVGGIVVIGALDRPVLRVVVDADDLVPRREQLRDQVAVDEPGSAGDEDLHSWMPPPIAPQTSTTSRPRTSSERYAAWGAPRTRISLAARTSSSGMRRPSTTYGSVARTVAPAQTRSFRSLYESDARGSSDSALKAIPRIPIRRPARSP